MPNFRILSQVVAKTSLTENNVHIYFIGVTEGKLKIWKKEGKRRISILIFIYTIHFAYLKVCTKLENTGSDRSREICDNNFHLENEKWTNKETDKQYVAVFIFFATQYNSSLKSVIPNFRILSQVVAEKSLTEKSLQTDRQTNRQTDKNSYRKYKNRMYSYTPRTGGIKICIE